MESQIFMKTKLKHIAKLKGYSNNELAERLNVTRETISRHMNGRTALSLEDVGRYSEILGVPPETIVFDQDGIDIFGILTDDNIVTLSSITDGIKKAIAPFSFPKNTAAILDSYNNNKKFWRHGCLYVFDKSASRNKEISSSSINTLSVFECYTKDEPRPQILVGHLQYDQTLKDNEQTYMFKCLKIPENGKNNLKLIWATPILNVYLKPHLSKIEIVD